MRSSRKLVALVVEGAIIHITEISKLGGLICVCVKKNESDLEIPVTITKEYILQALDKVLFPLSVQVCGTVADETLLEIDLLNQDNLEKVWLSMIYDYSNKRARNSKNSVRRICVMVYEDTDTGEQFFTTREYKVSCPSKSVEDEIKSYLRFEFVKSFRRGDIPMIDKDTESGFMIRNCFTDLSKFEDDVL